MVSEKSLNQNFKSTAVLTGVTASGKTALAIAFAKKHPEIEIINADSLLVYRGFNVGTAKPTPEELKVCPHHLIDIRDPDQNFTAGDFVREVDIKLAEIEARGNRALIVGGTGFYLKALLYGLWDSPKADADLRLEIEKKSSIELYDELFKRDEEGALKIGRNDRYRLIRATETILQSGKTPSQLESLQKQQSKKAYIHLLFLDRENTEIEDRIETRTQEMLNAGLVEEVKTLLEKYPESRPLESVGYSEVVSYLKGQNPKGRKIKPGIEGLAAEVSLATRQLVKRQRTWVKGQFGSRGDVEFFTLDQDAEKVLARLEEIY
jgi:tRNA dimethylallyltransferase